MWILNNGENKNGKKTIEDLKINLPTTIIIFGGTGDLAKRKLIPALFDLFIKGFLPDKIKIVGFAFDNINDKQFRKIAKQAIKAKGHGHRFNDIREFLETLHFQQGRFEKEKGYQDLRKSLEKIDKDFGTISNKFFYLAVPTEFYNDIFANFDTCGLSRMCDNADSWTRVMIEKPFGRDLETAKELNNKLEDLFMEDQIFRIDHYLAKETVQNILSFRFSNMLFEPIWNRKYIDRIEIKLREERTIEGRGAFYDKVGALRDVGQNHMLQLLALITMEHPGEFIHHRIREKRAEVLESLKRIPLKELEKHVARGQYKGYTNLASIPEDSETETFFKFKTEVLTDRWKGVPIYLESGKGLFESKTKITIYFKEAHMLGAFPSKQHPQNRLVFRIQPDEGITIVFWAKKPGFNTDLESKELTFYYSDKENQVRLPDAYEKVVFDTLSGDQTLFASTEEVEASWSFITPILEKWSELPLHEYEIGSYGPKVRETF